MVLASVIAFTVTRRVRRWDPKTKLMG